VEVVRQVADERVEDAVEHQRHHDAEADPRLRQTEHLVVVEQQEEREAVVLHAERDRADAVEDRRRAGQSAGSGHGRS
jgi:predicted NUDIX family phosphoesterase